MADTFYGTPKVNGFTQTGIESLTSNFEFITITMNAQDIRPISGGGDVNSQGRLDKIIEIVSERGQPVIMGNVTGGGNNVIMLAVEHPSAWQCVNTVTGSKLADRLVSDGINYTLAVTSVVFSNVLT